MLGRRSPPSLSVCCLPPFYRSLYGGHRRRRGGREGGKEDATSLAHIHIPDEASRSADARKREQLGSTDVRIVKQKKHWKSFFTLLIDLEDATGVGVVAIALNSRRIPSIVFRTSMLSNVQNSPLLCVSLWRLVATTNDNAGRQCRGATSRQKTRVERRGWERPTTFFPIDVLRPFVDHAKHGWNSLPAAKKTLLLCLRMWMEEWAYVFKLEWSALNGALAQKANMDTFSIG